VDDGHRWRFRLADDARFSGEGGKPLRPVTAADVAFAWNRTAAEGEAHYLLRDVEGYDEVRAGESPRLAGVRVADDETLEITLDHPHGAFDVVASHPSLVPLPRDRWSADEAGLRERPIGNGPYHMAEDVVPDRYVRLAPVEDWHGSTPELDELLFQLRRPESAFVAFQQERLDVGRIPEGALERALETYGRARGGGGVAGGVLTDPVPDLLGLGVHVRSEPFDEPEVRRALSMAVDRSALAANVGAAAAPATSLLLPGLPAGGERRCGHCRHDPEAAAATFAAHGVDELTIWVDAEGEHGPLINRLRRDLSAAGVSLGVEERPFDEWVEAVRTGEASVFRLGWAPEHRTGLDVLEPLLHSEGLWSHTGLADAELDRLVETARAATSRTRRRALLREAEERALELAAVIPLGRGEHRMVISDRVAGLRLDPLGRADLSRLGLESGNADGGGA
jgi:ABC-type oligopeptide transport system substrate-binding subunit